MRAEDAPPLHIGTSGDYAPFSTLDRGGERRGFDVDHGRRLARDLGREAMFVAFRWPELREALAAGRFDLAASGVTVRPDRLFAGRFTRPYAVSGATVLVRQRDEGRFAAAGALDLPGVRLVVNRGGHLEAVTRARFAHARIRAVESNQSLPALVDSGEADALVTDTIEAAHFVAAHPALVALPPFTRDHKALLVRADRLELLRAADEWLARREDDGWLNRQRRRWLGAPAEMTASAARVEAIVSLIEQRLGVMPWVAAAKRRGGRAIEDQEQERKVLARARTAAEQLSLPAEDAARLFTALIEAAKEIQRRPVEVRERVTLESLRTLLAELSQRLLAELSAARGTIDARRLRARLRQLEAPGVAAATRDRIAGAAAALVEGEGGS